MTLNIPTDVILQILSKLSSKCIARLRCVSKLWASLLKLDSTYFSELFLTQSITRPRLLFGIKVNCERYLYSSLQPHESSYKNSETSVTAEFHMSLPGSMFTEVVSGLIYFPNIIFTKPMVCNPSTRKCVGLPSLTRAERSFLGYNPINKQFSVLAFSSPIRSKDDLPTSYQILNLDSGKLFWRNLDCPLRHCPLASHICVNGILYYMATFWTEEPHKIVCFDLDSEEFKFIDQPCYGTNLVNFKGKLGITTLKRKASGKGRLKIEFTLYVLEDVEKQEWSKNVYLWPSILWDENSCYRVIGVTGTGEVVLHVVNPFYLYFFNVEKNILRRVEIKGLEAFKDEELVQCCVDYVEDLKALNWS